MVENDCEDQGYSRIADGCGMCRTTEVVKNANGLDVFKPVPLVNLNGYWRCPRCGASYGKV